MGLMRRYVAPRFVDLACSAKGLGKWRRRCVADLSGVVIEIGFGAGRNLAYYPSTVHEVIAIDPSDFMRHRATPQIAAFPGVVTYAGLDGQLLDVPTASVDAAVVTFSLCTIPDPAAALSELRRVVRPGGELRLLEHGLAPSKRVATWQRRLNGFEQWIADGCQLTRDPVALVAQSEWMATSTYQRFAPGPKPWSYFTSIRAR
jgi:ubiquinone/menaquinone biosynthesis C-methylase UbiE